MAIYEIEGRLVGEKEFWQNNTGGIIFSSVSFSPQKEERNKNPYTLEGMIERCGELKVETQISPKKGMSTRHKAGDTNPLEDLKNSRVHKNLADPDIKEDKDKDLYEVDLIKMSTEKRIHNDLNITKEDIENLNVRLVYSVNGQIFTPVDSFKTKDANINTGIKQSEGKLFYEFDWEFIESAAKRMQDNKGDKYPHWNWKKPIEIESLKQAINRHHIEVMKGNYRDGEDPLGHVVSYMCNAMMLWHQLKNKNESQQDYSKIFAQ